MRHAFVEARSKLGSHMTPTDRAKFESEWRELVSARQIIDRLKMNDASPADLDKLAAVAKVLAKNNVSLDQGPRKLEEMLKGNIQPHEWPPIINPSEAGGYYFTSGSAALNLSSRANSRLLSLNRLPTTSNATRSTSSR